MSIYEYCGVYRFFFDLFVGYFVFDYVNDLYIFYMSCFLKYFLFIVFMLF